MTSVETVWFFKLCVKEIHQVFKGKISLRGAMIKVVIVGGGFGGVYAARGILRALKHEDVQVTLLSKTNYFLFVPMLHEVATGSLCGHSLATSFYDIMKSDRFVFTKGVVELVDLKKRVVKTKEESFSYDYLVLGTGSTINFYGIKGAEHAFTLKSLNDAFRLKNHLISCGELARVKSGKEREQLLTVVVAGAGPTGIELALEAKEFLDQIAGKHESRVFLLQRGSDILPQWPKLRPYIEKTLNRHGVQLLLNHPVSEVGKDFVAAGNELFSAKTIVWTAGVKPSMVKTTPTIINDKGGVVVNEFLQVPSFPEVFVIGDCAFYTPKGKDVPMQMLAQVASEEGKHVAKNVVAKVKGKQLLPFLYELRGVFVSLGKLRGVGIVYGFQISGFFAWWMNRTVYLFKMQGAQSMVKTAYEWTLNLFMKRDTAQH